MTLDPALLELTIRLAEGAEEIFYDKTHGGFFQGEERPDLVLRLKGQFDGALPTESSLAVKEFVILAEMTGREKFREIAKKTLESYLSLIKEAPSGMGEMLTGYRLFLSKPPRLVLAGEKGRDALLETAARHFDPQRITMGNKGPVSEFTAGLKPVEDESTAYYCVGQTCQLPVNDAAALEALLTKMSAGSE